MSGSQQFESILSKLASIESQQKQVRKELAETVMGVEAMIKGNKMLKDATIVADIVKENKKLNEKVKQLQSENNRLRQKRNRQHNALQSENANLKREISKLMNEDINPKYGDDRSRQRRRAQRASQTQSTVKQEIQLKERLRSSSRTASTVKRETLIEGRSRAPSPDESMIKRESRNLTESSMIKTEPVATNLSGWETPLPIRGVHWKSS